MEASELWEQKVTLLNNRNLEVEDAVQIIFYRYLIFITKWKEYALTVGK